MENLNNFIIEFGGFIPLLSIFFLFLQAIIQLNCLYLFMICVIIFDYTLIGPKLKQISHFLKIDSPRPAYPQLNGMPSGHTQVMWLCFIFFTLQKDHFNSILFGILAIITSYQRVASKMHSLKQVNVGLIFGVILGFFWNYFYNLELKTNIPLFI